MGEAVPDVLAGRMHLVHHVQFADTDGRHEPGSGGVDWPGVVRRLGELGYDGDIGLEYLPTMPMTRSVAVTVAAIGR